MCGVYSLQTQTDQQHTFSSVTNEKVFDQYYSRNWFPVRTRQMEMKAHLLLKMMNK